MGCNVISDSLLHAKVYISEIGVIVGSSNASSNGLGYEIGGGLHEANIFTDDNNIVCGVKNWFEGKWYGIEKITDKMLNDAEIN